MLEVNAINTYRGAAHILHGVSLNVGANEVVCLVGRNGAGKTTTIESIMGFLPLRSGDISFGGENMGRLPPHERAKRGIGYSPEDCGVFPELSVSENLMISRWLGEAVAKKRGDQRSDPEEQAFAVFPEVKNLLTRQGLHLSGGQRKMVAVARAIMLSPKLLLLDVALAYALRPKLLFLDEPTSGVSTRDKGQIMDTIASVVRGEGITAVIVEHDMDVVFKYSDRIVVMAQGAILAQGTPDEIRKNEQVAMVLLGTSGPDAFTRKD